MMGGKILPALLLFALTACGGADAGSDASEASIASRDDTESGPSDEPEEAGEERGGETYSEFDDRRDSYGGARGTYAGDGCTVDCSGHDAGYRWAEERGISDPDSCGGKSWSFEEGCRAYAEGRAREEETGADDAEASADDDREAY